MAGTKHLQFEDRQTIEEMMKLGCTIQEIANKLQRSAKTIERELERASKDSYSAVAAESIARNNRKLHNEKLSKSARQSYRDKVIDTVEKFQKINSNITSKEIADLTGISEQKIKKAMKERRRSG